MRIFITGATSGIGLELAKIYLKDRHQVGICGRDLKKIPEQVINAYKNLTCYEVDVCNRIEINKTLKVFVGEQKLDLMIVNAGISDGRKTDLPDFDVAEKIIKVNVLGALYTIEAALSSMLLHRSGHIVTIGSVAASAGLPGAGAYCASKSAVTKLCESFAITLKKEGITVTTIAPGFVDTPLTKKNHHQMPFIMSAEDAALKIKYAIERKRVYYTFPWPMALIAWCLEKMPRLIFRKLMSLKALNYRNW